MTIPITSILPWVLIIILSLFLGAILAIFTSYPKDITKTRYCACCSFISAALTLTYASIKGWILWN